MDLREKLGCCARCALRFRGVRDPSAYSLSAHPLEASTPAGESLERAVAGGRGTGARGEDEEGGAEERAGGLEDGGEGKGRLGGVLCTSDRGEGGQERVLCESEGKETNGGEEEGSRERGEAGEGGKGEEGDEEEEGGDGWRGGEGGEGARKGCPLCLGCLSECVSSLSLSRIASQVLAEGYEMRTFAIAVSVPVSLLIRQRAAWLFLSSSAHEPCVPYDRIVELKDAFRWCVSRELSTRLGVTYDPFSPLTVHISAFSPPCASEHHNVVAQLLPAALPLSRKRKAQGHASELDSVRSVTRALDAAGADDVIRSSPLYPPPPPLAVCGLSVAVERANLYISGNYRKLSRLLPQSPWIIDGARKCSSSVQECIDKHAIASFQASSAFFHSAGREDVDVRMLGEGRPFVLELVACKSPYKSTEQFAALSEQINLCEVVHVSGLHECAASLVSNLIKDGEEAHRKQYRCIVWLSKALGHDDIATLNGLTDVKLQQRTPLRVAHRQLFLPSPRPTRALTIVSLRLQALDDGTRSRGTQRIRRAALAALHPARPRDSGVTQLTPLFALSWSRELVVAAAVMRPMPLASSGGHVRQGICPWRLRSHDTLGRFVARLRGGHLAAGCCRPQGVCGMMPSSSSGNVGRVAVVAIAG
ncbi:MAG: hypothetical protein SGPRY_001580 [Prymnesium sp.]